MTDTGKHTQLKVGTDLFGGFHVYNTDGERISNDRMAGSEGWEDTVVCIVECVNSCEGLNPTAIKDVVAALEEAEREMAVLSQPHILFEVHEHFQHTHWLWGSDSSFTSQGWFQFDTDGEIKELMTSEYMEPLENLLTGRTGDGIAYGRIPVRFGKYQEDPPWEPIFESACIIPLDGSAEYPALAHIRAALSALRTDTAIAEDTRAIYEKLDNREPSQ